MQYNAVNFVLSRKDGKILVQLRDGNTRKNPNRWCFPGGACECGETILEAVLRELEEETHLKLTAEQCKSVADFHYIQDGKQKTNRFFICYAENPEIFNGEGTFHWLTWEEISVLELALGENKMIDLLREAFNNWGR